MLILSDGAAASSICVTWSVVQPSGKGHSSGKTRIHYLIDLRLWTNNLCYLYAERTSGYPTDSFIEFIMKNKRHAYEILKADTREL